MAFDEFIQERFPDEWETDWADAPVLEAGMDYALTSGGKRVRPVLCLQLCDALEADMEQAQLFARAVETYHNFTLVHDDIIDQDVKRRGQDAVWETYGMDQGVMIGDGMHAMAYRYLIDNATMFDPDTLQGLLQVLNAADRAVSDGQSMDIAFRDRDDVTEEEYLTMARKKTGALLTAALDGATIIADVEDHIREQVGTFGETIGPAFQIRDDVIDLRGKKGREAPGQDIGEGKRSLIVVYALDRLPDSDRRELLGILDKPKPETTEDDVQRAITLFESVDAIDDANQRAVELTREAKDALAAIDAYDVTPVREIADFLVERKF